MPNARINGIQTCQHNYFYISIGIKYINFQKFKLLLNLIIEFYVVISRYVWNVNLNFIILIGGVND